MIEKKKEMAGTFTGFTLCTTHSLKNLLYGCMERVKNSRKVRVIVCLFKAMS